MLYDLCGVGNIVAAAADGNVGDELSVSDLEGFKSILPRFACHGRTVEELKSGHT